MKIIPVFRPAFRPAQLKTLFLSLMTPGNRVDDPVEIFEREFARYVGVRHAVSVPSGRWGLYYILRGLGFSEGDEIIVPAFTYHAVPAVIRKLGLKTVFADTAPGSLCIDPDRIEERITARTKAIIPTHLCGFPCQMEAIRDLAGRHGIAVIEDCCQSLGAAYKNRKTGAWGDAAFFTFGMTKHFTVLGGGMVVTDNAVLAGSIRAYTRKLFPERRSRLFLRVSSAWGMMAFSSRAVFPLVYACALLCSEMGIDIIDRIFRERGSGAERFPSRTGCSPVFAFLGIEQLKAADAAKESRKKLGAFLYEGLRDMRNIRIPFLLKDADNVFSSCPILVKEKDRIKKRLLRRGVDVSAGYLRYFPESGCFHAAGIEKEVLYLPLYPGLTAGEAAYITNTIKHVCA